MSQKEKVYEGPLEIFSPDGSVTTCHRQGVSIRIGPAVTHGSEPEPVPCSIFDGTPFQLYYSPEHVYLDLVAGQTILDAERKTAKALMLKDASANMYAVCFDGKKYEPVITIIDDIDEGLEKGLLEICRQLQDADHVTFDDPRLGKGYTVEPDGHGGLLFVPVKDFEPYMTVKKREFSGGFNMHVANNYKAAGGETLEEAAKRIEARMDRINAPGGGPKARQGVVYDQSRFRDPDAAMVRGEYVSV